MRRASKLLLLALKMEKESDETRNVSASGSWKRKGKRFSPFPSALSLSASSQGKRKELAAAHGGRCVGRVWKMHISLSMGENSLDYTLQQGCLEM